MANEFKVRWTSRGKSNLSEAMSLASAENLARELMPKSKVVTILRESDGSDHPSNKGKWFLFRIWK